MTCQRTGRVAVREDNQQSCCTETDGNSVTKAVAVRPQVFTAKRAAAMRVAEEQGTDRERPQRLSHDAKVRKRQREAAADGAAA